MKVTAQEEYGLRCILHLARAACAPGSGPAGGGRDRPGRSKPDLTPQDNPENPQISRNQEGPAPSVTAPSVTVAEIAESEGLSVQYAGKLIRILGKAGLVESVRGCKGGYRLARGAEHISATEILSALGSKMYEPAVCERYTGDRQFCVHSNDCSVRSLWSGLQLLIDQVLARTTLRDLVASERTVAQWMESSIGALESFLEHEPANRGTVHTVGVHSVGVHSVGGRAGHPETPSGFTDIPTEEGFSGGKGSLGGEEEFLQPGLVGRGEEPRDGMIQEAQDGMIQEAQDGVKTE